MTGHGETPVNDGVDISKDPAARVEEFLRLIMIPDPDAARRFVAPNVDSHFTGVRAMSDIAGKEQVESFDAFIEVAGQHSAEMIIKMLGKL